MADPRNEFIKAAKAGDLAKLRALLASDESVRDADGSTALHCATWKGHLEAVAYLLEAGSDVHVHNTNEHWGTTALHAAAHARKLLLSLTACNRVRRILPDSHGIRKLHDTNRRRRHSNLP